MTFRIGDTLQNGKYRIEQELGLGGFGVTYKAINQALGQVVVIKTVNDAWRKDPNFARFQQQFQDEARRLAKCSHPNIVRVSDFFVTDGLPCIVMDYIPGATLDALVLPDRPLSEPIALHYIRQVAEAVRAIHHNGLLHRDIKPHNVILQAGTDQVILIDFGISREFTPGVTQVHTQIASEGYAPIEQYLSQAKRTPATDVYGLAATLYTLLTARVPVAATLRDRVPFPSPRDIQPAISAGVNEAVMRGMAIEPRHRPASVEDWLSLLFAAPATAHPAFGGRGSTSQVATMAVAPPQRRTPPSTQEPVPQRRRNSAKGWIAAVVALAAIVPFAVGYNVFRRANQPMPESSPPAGVESPSPTVVPENPQPLDIQPDNPDLPVEDGIPSEETEASPETEPTPEPPVTNEAETPVESPAPSETEAPSTEPVPPASGNIQEPEPPPPAEPNLPESVEESQDEESEGEQSRAEERQQEREEREREREARREERDRQKE